MEGGRLKKSVPIIDAQSAVVREAKRLLKQRLKVCLMVSFAHINIYKYSILTSFQITDQDKEKNMVQKPLHPKSEGEAATPAAV